MSIWTSLLTYVAVPWVVLVLSLYALAAFLPPAMSKYCSFGARVLAYLAGVIICASYGATAAVLLKPLGYGGLAQWMTAKAFKWLMWPLLGVWMDVEDENGSLQTRPCVMLGNHQT